MNVPYEEKDTVKSMGAKWNPSLKKWYYEGPVIDYIRFAKWITEERELTFIACNDIFILEGMRTCFKCEKPTRVIGLGINEHVMLFQRDDGSYEIDVIENYEGWEPLHVGWVEDEEDIPPALLRYLLKNYNVRKGFSKTAGECFANHCDSCGVIQGNYHLFEEDSPLMVLIPDCPEVKKRISELKIYCIGIDDDIVLDWNIGYGDNDGLYFKYGTIEYLSILPDKPDDDVVTYEELFK